MLPKEIYELAEVPQFIKPYWHDHELKYNGIGGGWNCDGRTKFGKVGCLSTG